MTAPDIANGPKETGHISWRAIAFACLGAIVGAGYGFGISSLTECSPRTTWLFVFVGSGLLGLTGYTLSDSPDYSTVQKVILLPLVPVVFVASSVGVVFVIALFGVLYPVFAIQNLRREHRFRAQMKAAGRYITWQDLLPSLKAGQGTLLEESSGTGPYRIWYTPDDVLAKGEPISSDEELLGVFSGKICHLFNSRCCREYLAPDDGKAFLTTIRPARVTSGRIQKRFPRIKVVRLIRPAGRAVAAGPPP